MSSSLAEQLAGLGLTDNNDDGNNNNNNHKVFSVELLLTNKGNNDDNDDDNDDDGNASLLLFDDQQRKQGRQQQQQRQKWLGRPAVEQTVIPSSSSSNPSIIITLQEMATKVNFVWSNRIVFVKTIRSPFCCQAGGVWTLVEQQQDNNNNDNDTISMTLSLWNYLPLQSGNITDTDDMDKIMEWELPKSSYLAISNPLMVPNTIWENTTTTPTTTNNKNSLMMMLRCDNPECIRLFDNQQEWKLAQQEQQEQEQAPPTADSSSFEELVDQANQALEQKAYRASIRLYQQALRAAGAGATESKSNDSSTTTTTTAAATIIIIISCWNNMTKACLQLGKYDDAVKYARTILNDYDATNIPARFHLAQALVWKNQPNEAKDLLLQLRKDDAENDAKYQALLGDCLQSIMEQRMGRYNIPKMLQEVATMGPTSSSSSCHHHHHHADYLSPKIDLGVSVIRPSDGGTYRGVLAKADISEGTLLSASKAFAFAYHNNKRKDRQYISESTRASQKRHMYEVSQVHQAVLKLQNNPSLVSKFYKLEAAGEINDKDDGEDDTTTTTTTSTSTTTTQHNIIDLAKIRSILESNRFGVDLNSPASPFEIKSQQQQQDDENNESNYFGVGLWLQESMFNHSCTPNCTWAQIGNHMFVYAAKDIKSGDECCISYVHAALSYQDRKDRFSKWSGGKGFECGCEWCHSIMRKKEELREMNEEINTIQKRLGTGEMGVTDIGRVLTAKRRRRIQKVHAGLPERFQHTIYNIHMLEALQRANEMDRRGALKSVKAAAALGYAIRGGLRQETRTDDLCCLVAASMACSNSDNEKDDNDYKTAKEALTELCQNQIILPSLTEFQTFVMMNSMTFWNPYQSEPFMQRWANLNKEVWEKRSKELR